VRDAIYVGGQNEAEIDKYDGTLGAVDESRKHHESTSEAFFIASRKAAAASERKKERAFKLRSTRISSQKNKRGASYLHSQSSTSLKADNRHEVYTHHQEPA